MSNGSPLRRSMALVEFLSCADDVEAMLGQGFSRRLIYERLKKEGRFSMAYVTFTQLIAKAAKNELKIVSLRPEAKPVPTPASKPPSPRPSQPKVIKAASDALQDPRTVDPSTLF